MKAFAKQLGESSLYVLGVAVPTLLVSSAPHITHAFEVVINVFTF